MPTNFLISKITVNFPDSGNGYTPIVYKTNSNGQIVFGLACPSSTDLEDPIKIHQGGVPLPSGNSYIQIATSRGQYQIYWTNGTDGQYVILLQSLTSPNPYPSNQKALWTGTNTSQNFTLSIDMTQLASGDGISIATAS